MNALTNVSGNNTTSTVELEILTTHVDDSEQMSYTTYGISVKDETGQVLSTFLDISTSKKYVQGFIDMIKGRDVAAIHIGDILEDYLD